jgi:hypothetical protein
MDRQVGTTSQIIQVSIANSSTGAGLTGLAYNTSGLIAYYKRNSATASVAISLATMTLGTWATGGFKEVDATHMPGLYEIGIPNAALVSGADLLAITLQGAASMASVTVQVGLTANSNQDGVRGGMTALPNAAAAAAGGLTTSATGYIVLKKNTALNNFLVYMVSSVDNVTPVTGATVSGQRSIDGGAFGACANSVTEVGLGLYVINLATTDTNGNCIMFQFTASGCAINPIPVYTQP